MQGFPETPLSIFQALNRQTCPNHPPDKSTPLENPGGVGQPNPETQNPRSSTTHSSASFSTNDDQQPAGSTNGPIRQRDQKSRKDPRTPNQSTRPHQPRRHRPTNRPQPNTQTTRTNTSSQHRTRTTPQQSRRNPSSPLVSST